MFNEALNLTNEWDKVFSLSDKVNHKKVTFTNHFGITLAADMYTPKNASGKLPAIAVSGPYGAVKEQASGLYAQEMAKRGFITIAFDPSFTGESGGTPRYMTSPDFNVEDFQTAIDFLSVQDNVDADKISIIGICGWGGVALQTACLDTNDGWAVTGMMSLMNMRQFEYADEIDSAVLLVHGEKAHSCYMSKDAYKLLKGDNKEMLIIPNAVHTDLYDKKDIIPFDKIEEFIRKNIN